MRRRAGTPSELKLPGEPWLGYLAGIIDGEGSIKQDPGGRPGKVRWSMQIQVSNTDPQLMAWLEQIGGRVYSLAPKKNGIGTKPCYMWSVYRFAEVIELLQAVLPYLIIKRERAIKALEAMRLRKERPGWPLRVYGRKEGGI